MGALYLYCESPDVLTLVIQRSAVDECAFNDVNLAGACILTTTECAVRMGISRDKWIFPLGGGRAEDSKDCEFPYSEPCYLTC